MGMVFSNDSATVDLGHTARPRRLREGAPPPDLATIKDFCQNAKGLALPSTSHVITSRALPGTSILAIVYRLSIYLYIAI